jgi:hypothetical protein
VALLLPLPGLGATPLFDQSVAIGLDKRLGLVVVGLEEERHAKDRERQRPAWIQRSAGCMINRPRQVPLPDVPVGSQGVADELDRHHERGRGE